MIYFICNTYGEVTFSVLYCNHLRISGSAFVFYFNCLEFSVRADT